MEKGYIKLHRKITDSGIFKNDKHFKIFIYILLHANYEDGVWINREGYKIEVKKGEFLTSIGKIAQHTQNTIQSVRTTIKKLEKMEILTNKTTNKYTIFQVQNWDKYQQNQQTKQQTEQQTKQQTEQQTEQQHIKKSKEETKKVKEEVKNTLVAKSDGTNQQQTDPIFDSWNCLAKEYGLSTIIKRTDKRRKAVIARSKDKHFDYPAILEKIKNSKFMKGGGDRGWKVTFDYIFLSQDNYIKILEGNLDDADKNSDFGEFYNDLAGFMEKTEEKYQ